MLFALTTDQKLGLAGTAAVFIAFSLLAAFVLPRGNPDFPGRRGLVPFILVTVILTIAMLGAVEVFAKEEHGEAAGQETTPEPPPPPASPTPQPQEPPPPTETAPEEPSGSPEAGREVFAAQGCGSCHTFAPAGTSGATGPDLDESLDGKDPGYVRRAIVDPDAEIAEGYSPGVMPKTYEQQLSPKQLNDLVAFLTSG
ncbi:MAG TPA: cytochrome c [Gaiellaceae bacterium]|nr:cytochrome c [Gaiellaceae bacterium]